MRQVRYLQGSYQTARLTKHKKTRNTAIKYVFISILVSLSLKKEGNFVAETRSLIITKRNVELVDSNAHL